MTTADPLTFERTQLRDAVAAVRRVWNFAPRAGIVLGSGFNRLIADFTIDAGFEPSDIPHYPAATATGHRGRFLCGHLGDIPLLIMDGRLHAYEGHSPRDVVFPIRLMIELGIRSLFLTNAAGAVNPNFKEGDLVLITDHINLQWLNPLRGPNDDAAGPRFPDMSQPYDPVLMQLAEQSAHEVGLKLQRGVYLAMSGPNYETPAEYRMIQCLGADLVGMSTVPEVLTSRHAGVPVLALSVVSNVFRPDTAATTDSHQVIETVSQSAASAGHILKRLLGGSVSDNRPGF